METEKNRTTQNRLLRPEMASLVQGKKITIGPPAADAASGHAHPDSNQHAIQVNRNDLGVESIEVVCSCGEHIVIRCEYAQ